MSDVRELWFESHGSKLFAVEAGRGRPIVLLHGGLATHEACWLFAAPLAGRFRIVTPDLRASGRSFDPGPLSWDLLADDVAALVRVLGGSRAVIGGISFGAGVATRVALRHPEIVDALVVLHPAFGGAELGLAPAQVRAMAAMDAAGSRAIAEGIDVLFPLFDALPPAIRGRARALDAPYDPASVAASTRFMASGAQPFGTARELSAIAAPTLVVPGIDREHPVEVAELYRAHVPRCTLRSVAVPELAATIEAFVDDAVA